jgi:glycosyltransferase involved in cell wall biosynthesis
MRIAILSPSIMTADAVGNDVVGMYHALRQRGHDVQLFAGTWTVTDPPVRHFDALPRYLSSESDLLLYHHSIGWEDGVHLLQQVSCKRAVRYHNVTPPEFFAGISDDYANICRLGRAQLKTLAELRCDRYLFASDYNRQEFLARGVPPERTAVVFPFHHTNRLHDLPGDLAVLDAYRDGKTNLLTVGRVAPNKGHAFLLYAFAVYHHEYNRDSRLLIVGKEDERLKAYGGFLRGLAEGLGVEDAVHFSGAVTDAGLKAYYLAADVFLGLSEHEGFGIPLVEAMALKVPVVARGASGIPGTVGDAGLVWEERDPDLVAESIDYVVRSERARAALGALGWRRYREWFTTEKIRDSLYAALDGLC